MRCPPLALLLCTVARFAAAQPPPALTIQFSGPLLLRPAGPNIAFLNYTDVLPACVAAAKAAGAQRIIALTHIGYQDDQALAADPAAAGVDLIVGARRQGHMPQLALAACSHWAFRGVRTFDTHLAATLCRWPLTHPAVWRARSGWSAPGGSHPASPPRVAAHQREQHARRALPHPHQSGRRQGAAHCASAVGLPVRRERRRGGSPWKQQGALCCHSQPAAPQPGCLPCRARASFCPALRPSSGCAQVHGQARHHVGP